MFVVILQVENHAMMYQIMDSTAMLSINVNKVQNLIYLFSHPIVSEIAHSNIINDHVPLFINLSKSIVNRIDNNNL